MSPRPTVVVATSYVNPSPTGSDVTAGEMAAPMMLTPTPPATPSPPPNQGKKQVCGTSELRLVRQLRLRVISREMSLQRLCLHVPNLRDLTLDGSVLLSLRDLGCGLIHLRKLRVARCGLDSLDGLFGLMNLRELHAADNQIDDIGQCSALEHIKRIDLSRNRVTDISYVSFLKVCPSLKHLLLAGCPAAEDARYRAEVRRRLPQLVTLDGEPLHRGAARPDADDDSDDSDDDGGGRNDASPFGSDDGGDDDDRHFYPEAGDAGTRPSSGRRGSRPLEVLRKAPSKEMLPPLQHSMTQLPPLRPLQPLPPIGSRPSSAGSNRPGAAVVASKRPATGHPRHKQTADVGVSVSPLVAKPRPRATVDTKRTVVVPDPAKVDVASASAAGPAPKNISAQPTSASTLGQPTGSSNKLPERKAVAGDAAEGNRKAADKPPERTRHKKLTHEDCLTLDMEERVKRWAEEILDNPTLEDLERQSLLAAEREDVEQSSDEEAVDDPGPSTSRRR